MATSAPPPAVALAPPKVGLRVSFKDRIKALQSGTAAVPEVKQEPPTKPNTLLVEVAANPAENMKEQLIPTSSSPAPIIVPKSVKPSAGISLKEKIKSLSGQATASTKEEPLKPWSKLKLATVVSGGGSYTSLNNSFNEDSPTGAGPPSNSTGSKSSVSDQTISGKSNPSERILKGIMKHSSCSTTGHRKIQSTTELERIKHKKPTRPAELTSVSDSEQSLSSSKSFLKRSQKEHEKHSRSKLGSASLKRRPKNYRSVDDLSPEYSGLPFVKKLKILNERQKLAELEHVIQTRSFSLDCPESIVQQTIYSGGTSAVAGAPGPHSTYPVVPFDPTEPLTRSQSDASGMAMGPGKYSLKHHRLFQRPQPLDTLPPIHHPAHTHQSSYYQQQQQQYFQPHSPLSPESNETMERKQLKSILKRLSEDQAQQGIRSHPAAGGRSGSGSGNVHDLMRAPTVEGYVARHSKLLKSVTFNNTLSSPPPLNPLPAAVPPAVTGSGTGSGTVSGPVSEAVPPTRSSNNSPASFFADLYDPVGVALDDPALPGRPALHASATTMTTTETTVITSTTVINNANQVNGPQRLPNALNPLDGLSYGPPAPYEELQLSEKIREDQLIRDSVNEPILSEFSLKSNVSKQKKLMKGKRRGLFLAASSLLLN